MTSTFFFFFGEECEQVFPCCPLALFLSSTPCDLDESAARDCSPNAHSSSLSWIEDRSLTLTGKEKKKKNIPLQNAAALLAAFAASLRTPPLFGAVALISEALSTATAKSLLVVRNVCTVQEATAAAASSTLAVSASSFACFFFALSPFPGRGAGVRFRGALIE